MLCNTSTQVLANKAGEIKLMRDGKMERWRDREETERLGMVS